MKKHLFYLIVLFLPALIITCSDSDDPDPGNPPGKTAEVPKLTGKLIYHNYTTYDTHDSRMWLYDFATNKLECISDSWDIINPMNAHFSPNGKQIVFMGIGPSTDSWDIFLYTLGSNEHPINLTPTGNARDEDPKYSPDGKKVAFKRNFCVAEMDLSTRNISILSPSDYSMPYYNHDGTKMVCSKSDGPTSSIAVIDLKTKELKTLYDAANVQDYYPINADEKSFYYSVGYTPSNRIDQVYRGFWNGLQSERLPFNGIDGDYSDAYPVNKEWVVISSTRTGTRGGYDLYIAHVETGDIFPMTDYNTGINTSKNELGACIYIE